MTLYEKGLKAVEANKAPNAIKYYREAINLKPDFYQAHNNLGTLYKCQGNLREAINSYSIGLKFSPENPIILNNIGTIYRAEGQLQKALKYFLNSSIKEPNYLLPKVNTALTYIELEQKDDAAKTVASLKQYGLSDLLINILMLKIYYDLPNSENYLAAINFISHLLSALNSIDDPDLNKLINNITLEGDANCFLSDLITIANLKGFKNISDKLLIAAENDPRCADQVAFLKLAKIINSPNCPSDAILLIKNFKHQYPNNHLADNLLFNFYFWSGLLDDAKNVLDNMSDLNLSMPQGHHWFLFQDHKFRAAWTEYSKSAKQKNTVERNFSFVASDLINKRIFIDADQGPGDQVMFLSCLPDLLCNTTGPVSLKCDPRLERLISRDFPKVSIGIPTEPAELEFNLSSLASVYRNTLGSFFLRNKSYYITSDQELRSKWRSKISKLPQGLNIGFAWRGGVSNKKFAQSKSMNLETFIPLFSTAKTNWINLQYDATPNEIHQLSNLNNRFSVYHFDELDLFNDLEGQISLIDNLDLIIQTANTSIHFAGALGVKSWVLLGHPHDFRWFSNGVDEQSAWYPSVRMIKKQQKQSWEELVESLVPELTALAASKS